MIPNDFIQTLLSRVDIVEVIDRYVPLRKAGERVRRAHIGFHHADRRQKPQRLRALQAPGRHRHFCTGGNESGNEVPPYETAAAYDEDPGEAHGIMWLRSPIARF